MASSFEFEALVREGAGTGTARALRRNKMVPAVLYGGHVDPVNIELSHNHVAKRLEHEAVFSHILTIKIGDKIEQVILKDVQRHPYKPIIMHLDFQRVSRSEKIRVHVPLHFIGEDDSAGIKKGGIVMHGMVDVEVTCLPDQLPESIDVDMSKIDLGGSVHLSELIVPDGVEVVALTHGAEQDALVATIQSGKVEVVEVDEEQDAATESDEEN